MIEKMNHHYSMTNPATVYNEEALTALELVGRTTAKVNECVDMCNETETTTRDHLNAQDKTIDDRMDAQDKAIPEKVTSEVQKRIDDGSFDHSIDKYAGELESRVNNLLGSVTEGTTTRDAEVIDIRTGADGETYDNAGEATRGQFNKAVAYTDERTECLSIRPDWSGVGYLISDNTIGENTDYRHTDYVHIYGRKIRVRVFIGFAASIILFNKSKDRVKYLTNPDANTQCWCEFVIEPSESYHYIRLCCVASYCDNSFVRLEDAFTTNFIEDSGIQTRKLGDGCVVPEKTSFLTHDETTNLIDHDRMIADHYIDGSDALLKPYKGFYTTGIIPIKANTDYAFGNLYQGHYVFYDENYSVIEKLSTANSEKFLPNPFTTPENCAYASFTCINATQAKTCWVGSEKECRYLLDNSVSVPFNRDIDYADFSVFNKCLCIGDSLTAGTMNTDGEEEYINKPEYSFPTYLEKLTGVETVNMGLGGTTSSEWYSGKKNTDLSGYDVALIQLGVNDAYRYNGWTDTSKTAFTNIVNKLQTENKGIKIFVSTIIPASSYQGAVMDEISSGIREWVAERADSDVYLVDLALNGHTNDDTGFNAGHLSAYGYWQLAKDWKNNVGHIMQSNRSEFRLVQFIGTDYKY